MSEVTITVSGPCGSGKSALLGEIEIMCKALSIPVRYADEKSAQADKNMNHADWTSELEMYKPSVVLVEDMPWLRATATPAPADSTQLDPVVEANCELLHQRSQVGIRKYGVTLGDAKLSERALTVHALEEVLDLSNYLQAQLQRIDSAPADSAAERDAARYRWLRDPSNTESAHYVASKAPADLDAAIDAAMHTTTGKEE